MVSFGERLKRTRENKKMSIDDVSRATKIAPRMLSALEESKFDQLPGGVFNKGFVRAYARHLGLDEEQAVRDYNSAAGSVTAEIKPEDAELRAIAERKEKERQGRPGSDGLPWGMIAAFLLVLALGDHDQLVSVSRFLFPDDDELPLRIAGHGTATPHSE